MKILKLHLVDEPIERIAINWDSDGKRIMRITIFSETGYRVFCPETQGFANVLSNLAENLRDNHKHHKEK